MIPLQLVVLLLTGVLGTAVVLTRDTLKQVLVLGVFGLALVLLLVVFQAPDVAFSGLVASTVALPFVLLVTIAKVRSPAVIDLTEAEDE